MGADLGRRGWTRWAVRRHGRSAPPRCTAGRCDGRGATTILDETRQRRQYALAERLRDAAGILAPGWAGSALDAVAPAHPAGEGSPPFVRVGTAAPLDDARFPALVPMFGSGHLAMDADAGDPRVAGLLRAVLLRLLAATPAGALLVRVVDATGVALAPFAALGDAGPAATDADGLRAVLAEAERWVAPDASGPRRHDRSLLLVLAALPEPHLPGDLARIEALAEQGPAAGLHLVVAGWPVAGRAALPRATSLAMRTAYALLGNPPGAAFAGTDGGLNSPVFVDPDPPTELVETVCRRIAAQVEAGSRLALSHLLPSVDELGQAAGTDGLTSTVGDAGGRPVSLGFTELTPHWLVSGRSRGCRSTFLTTALLGLVARYGPEELSLYLVDLGAGESFAEFLQTERDRSWIPQVRAAAMAADREYVLDLLDQLTAEVQRRAEASAARVGSASPSCGNIARFLGSSVCWRTCRCFSPNGTGSPPRWPPGWTHWRGPGGRTVFTWCWPARVTWAWAPVPTAAAGLPAGQFALRVALPGGGGVLDHLNDAAATLPVGSAVVNTAGGLGGPRGAIRGHERMVRFPDPADEPEAVTGLRHRLWSARPPNATPPVVFAGYARPLLGNDPRYRAAVAGQSTVPAALLGRVVDVSRSTATVSFGPAAGRNLAVLGPRPAACRLLATAAHTTAAHHRPVRRGSWSPWRMPRQRSWRTLWSRSWRSVTRLTGWTSPGWSPWRTPASRRTWSSSGWTWRRPSSCRRLDCGLCCATGLRPGSTCSAGGVRCRRSRRSCSRTRRWTS